MRVIPVMDLRNGVVVRGIAGRRHEYRPIASALTSSHQTIDVATAFRDSYGLSEIYIADLDAIAGSEPSLSTYCAVREKGFRLWVDAGIREAKDAYRIAAAGVDYLVVGTETVDAPDTLVRLRDEFGIDRIVFSLDLKSGVPLAKLEAWQCSDAAAIASKAISLGIGKVIVLELSSVGTNTGPAAGALCGQLARLHPHVEILYGGGIRNLADLLTLRGLGVRGALVASAIHDGALTPADLAKLHS